MPLISHFPIFPEKVGGTILEVAVFFSRPLTVNENPDEDGARMNSSTPLIMIELVVFTYNDSFTSINLLFKLQLCLFSCPIYYLRVKMVPE